MSPRRSTRAGTAAAVLGAGAVAVVGVGIGVAVSRPGGTVAPAAAARPAGHAAATAPAGNDTAGNDTAGNDTAGNDTAGPQPDVLAVQRHRARQAAHRAAAHAARAAQAAHAARPGRPAAELPFTGGPPVAPTLALGLLLTAAGGLIVARHPALSGVTSVSLPDSALDRLRRGRYAGGPVNCGDVAL